MTPILYEENTSTFSGNGLGRLNAKECYVDEERNGKYELEMEYPISGNRFSDLVHSRIIFAKPSDGKSPQPFRIYGITKTLRNTVKVKAEHISYWASHIPVKPPVTASSVTQAFMNLADAVTEPCPFALWTDKTSSGTFKVEEPKSLRSVLGGSQGSILDAFGGGEYEWDGFTIKLHQNRGQDKGVKITYGKNLTDLEQEELIDSTITGVMPYWKGTVDDIETIVMLPENVLHSENAENFPYNRTAVLDLSSEFDDEPTVEQLRSRATSWMTANNIGVPKVKITVKFVPLWQSEEYKDVANLERVNLCDYVHVHYEKLGVDAVAKVVRTRYNVLKERYEEIELGDARSVSFAESVKSDLSGTKSTMDASFRNIKNVFEAELEHTAELIRGGLGGYKYEVVDADGHVQETLYMDTPDINTAVNIIRINKNGIGFSNDGYDPSKFVSAWTIDGHFNADFISTGHLLANFIQGGTLKMGGADNGNGVIQVYDASGNVIGTWDKDGLSATGDLAMVKGDMRSNIGVVDQAFWKTVEGTTGWRTAQGFAVRLFVGSTPTTQFAVFPESATLREQIYSTGEWVKEILLGSKDSRTHYNKFSLGSDDVLRFVGASVNTFLTLGGTEGLKAPGLSVTGGGNVNVKSNVRVESGLINIGAAYSSYSIPTTPSIYVISDYFAIYTGRNEYLSVGDKFAVNDGSGEYIQIAHTAMVRVIGESSLDLQNGSSIDIAYGGKLEGTTNYLKYNNKNLAYDSSSARRYKHDIKPIESDDLDPHRLLSLPIVQFVWRDDHPLQYGDMAGKTIPGIIAEDVDDIYPAATIHNLDTGEIESWDERRIIPGMLALIQEQDERIKKLEDANKELLTRLERLEKMLT